MGAVKIYKRFRELLDVDWAAIADGEFLKRVGTTIVGDTPAGGESGSVMWVGKTAALAVLTSGAPGDIGSLALPAWLTRFMCKAVGSTIRIYADTASGTLAAATFIVRTGANGTGISLVTTLNGPTAAAGITTQTGLGVAATGTNIYFRQTANSANAGTITFTVEVSLI